MNNNLQFTRYLYNKDEVELTLLECILKNNNFNEIYFWTTELYKSNDPEELWQFIFKIYYDFYYINYPTIIKKIISYYNKDKKNNNIKYILFIIYNLSRASKNIDFNIFLSRTYFSSRLTYIIKNINLSQYYGDSRFEKLLNFSITTKNNEYIAYYLKKIIKSKNIEQFLLTNFNITIDNTNPYKDKFHKYLTLCLDIPKVKNKFIFKKVPKSAYMDVKTFMEKKENIHYKVLKNKRLYATSNNLGCFCLNRSYYILNREFWYNWEFHAYKCLIWKKRFDKYKIKISKNKKQIEFLNDDEMEEFYSQYGYEPDEQSKETQEKSIKNISSISFNDWIKIINQPTKSYKIEKKLKY
tara:strand:- start:414 stop:1475 length:1062 start_codon:yes stop_codon:yes gene_type:complete